MLITEVVRNSPADQAGIKPGDILVSIDGKAINNWSSMLETVANLPPGKIVPIKMMRNGAETVVQVKIGKRPKPKAQ